MRRGLPLHAAHLGLVTHGFISVASEYSNPGGSYQRRSIPYPPSPPSSFPTRPALPEPQPAAALNQAWPHVLRFVFQSSVLRFIYQLEGLARPHSCPRHVHPYRQGQLPVLP
ncbi:hypothetical protein BDN71DRAFT_462113 [Pleurotus eryngii]|uniref:Uncharacterized protein n=1 Tax=Pleurotus eryngii TaxID=5323 RepID=A0A9P5ZJL0_PLEER|nr:hypothetical protein BDN71DRAFT_462113 [Pleurotus eryngii]